MPDPAQPATPYRLGNSVELTADPGDADTIGAIWRLQMPERDLDSNIVALPPGERIEWHAGPDLDVLVHVLAGSGRIDTAADGSTGIDLTAGDLVWLPRGSGRRFIAGAGGMRHLTVHHRRHPSLTIQSGPPPGL